MEFSRKEIDTKIDEMMVEARSNGTSPESLFMIDAPLREYVVAVEQIKAQGGEVDAICESSVLLVCSMMTNLAAAMPIRVANEAPATAFIAFCNVFMHELAVTINDVANRVDGNNSFAVTRMDPGRTNH